MYATNDKLYSTTSLTKITQSDKALLTNLVKTTKPQSKNYEDSWGYIIQATRYDGFKWYDKNTNALIFFGRKSEKDSTLVVPSFFTTPQHLTEIVNKVQIILQVKKTILKNINPEEVNNFLPYGFRSYKKTEMWNIEARYDDQTYPQLIIDLKKLIHHQGGGYKKLRTALNKYPNFTFRKYHQSDKNEVLKLFALKDCPIESTEDRSQGMYFSSHNMYPEANIDKFVLIDNWGNNIIGFTATSDISHNCTALVASIFNKDIKIASSWGIYQTLTAKYHEGFQLANLGGCETGGTYNFMHGTFQPIEEIEKTHLVYDP